MMQGITGGMQTMPPPRQDSKMTTEQSNKLSALLEAYDTSSLSDEDAKALVSEIEELGIGPGRDLVSALGDAGIDAKALADQAGIGKGDRPPPPPGSGQGQQGVASVDEAAVSLISDAVAAFEASDDDTASLWTFLEPALEDAGYDTSQPVIDFYA